MSEPTIGEVLAELRGITSDVSDIKHTCKNLQISSDSARDRLTRIEVRQENAKEATERAFSVIKGLEERVQRVELEQPLTKLVRDHVVKAVLGILAIIAPLVAVQIWATNKNSERPVMVVDKEVVERWRSLNQLKEQ